MFLSSHKKTRERLCEDIKSQSDDMHKVSALHLQMILEYYDDVLKQAKASFFCAVCIALLGFVVLVGTMVIAIRYPSKAFGIGNIGVISGGLIEFTSAVVFFVYRRATDQFSAFHICLERTNRYLMAFNIDEMIDGRSPEKDQARRDLACIIANAPMIGQKDPGPVVGTPTSVAQKPSLASVEPHASLMSAVVAKV